MSLQRKMIVVALACAMPWVSAQAQSASDLKAEIEALKAQLQTLMQKVDSMGAASDNAALVQQVNRIEQKQDLAADDQEKAGLKGLKINGTIEAGLLYDDMAKSHKFSSSAGSGYGGESAMLQFTKESQDGEGVDWTLRLLPGSASYLVHEASISIPINKENRIIGGIIPDYQGYEFVFSNANPTLGSQLITHNALYDVAGPTSYTGIGMSHTFSNGTYALKWIVGNIDGNLDDATANAKDSAGNPLTAILTSQKTVGLAARADWFINEFSYVGLSYAHGSVNRNFDVAAFDGGYTHGDWAFNGQFSAGTQRNAAANGDDASWMGVSGLVGYKLTPRLQLLARADYVDNSKNGGGTYAYNGVSGSGAGGVGLGPQLDSSGAAATDATTLLATTGANLTRVSLGTNYQINANTQWKVEYRLDQSSGYNFTDVDSKPSQSKNTLATTFVVSF